MGGQLGAWFNYLSDRKGRPPAALRQQTPVTGSAVLRVNPISELLTYPS